MKAILVPMYFVSGMDEDYGEQLIRLRELLKEEAHILDPIAMGDQIPVEAILYREIVI